jgi:hypothetical protein
VDRGVTSDGSFPGAGPAAAGAGAGAGEPRPPAAAATRATLPVAVAREIARAGTLLDLGDRAGARRLVRRLLDTAPAAALQDLADVAADLGLTTGAAEEPPARPDGPRWVPPSQLRVYRRPPPSPSRRRGGGVAAAARDHAERRHVDNAPTRAERPVGYGLDYDRAAVPSLRGAPCLGCGVERSRADHARGDGLCEGCTDDGLTTEVAIAARAEGVLARHGAQARAELRRWWSQLDRGQPREALARWVAAHAAGLPDDR